MKNENIVSVSLGGFHSSALTSFGRLFTWGYNLYGQLGDGTTVDKLVPQSILHHSLIFLMEKLLVQLH